MTEPDAPKPLYDDAAERIVLGALMLAPDLADAVFEILTSRDFYRPGHAALYAHLVAHIAAGDPVDPAAVAIQLAPADLQRLGGGPYLFELIQAVPTAANAPWFARVVSEHAQRRRLIEATHVIQQQVHSPRPVGEVQNLAQQAILDATAGRQTVQVTVLGSLVDEVTEELLSDEGPERGLSTGLGSLDDVIGGLKPGQLILAAGRPGSGKSVFCVDVSRAAARRDVPALIVSLEMHRTEILARILAAEADVNLYRLLNGGLKDWDKARVREATGRLRPQPMHIDTTRSADIGTIRSNARRLKARHGLGLLVVDYLQLMQSTQRTDNRAQELGEISRGLKLLAGDLEIPIVAAAQLNRQSESRHDRRPQLSDLRESGSLEQDADIVILIHRPDQHDPEHERTGEVDLIVAKNRNGPQETVTAAAQLEYSRIVDIGVPA